MNAKIRFKNKKIYKGERIADIFVRSCRNLKSINCPSELNSRAIDEFLIIFLIASKAKGVSYFRNLSELNQKESPRLKVATKILRMMGVKIISTNKDIKIYGNPNLNLNKSYVVKNFMKDHRVFMMSCIAALSLGGKWKIYDKDSVKTSFPKFISLIKSLGGKIN
jgi:3-phosphoshikimate 1-carboxyvinyltransferase